MLVPIIMTSRGPNGNHRRGERLLVDEARAAALVEAGCARFVTDEPETEVSDGENE